MLDSDAVRTMNPNLTGLIKRGLVDREVVEGIAKSEEVNSMRFAASCATLLAEHVSDTTDAVRLDVSNVLDVVDLGVDFS